MPGIFHTHLEFITEGKLDIVTKIAKLFGIISPGSSFLMTFYVVYTAVDVDSDGSEFASIKQLFKDFENNISEYLSCFIAEDAQKSGYRFWFSHRNTKLVYQWILLQQFEPFQFINSNKVAAEQRFDMVHLDLVC